MPPLAPHAAPVLLEVMKRNPVTVAPATTLDEVLLLLERYGFRHLPVVEENRVVGMISDRDVYLATGMLGSERRLRDERGRELPGPRLAAEIQRRPVHCLSHEATVLEGARDMLHLRVGAIPVVERGGEDVLCGIVTETDLLRVFLELCRSGEIADAPAREHMRSPMPCVAPETPNEEALQRLDPEIRHLGVLRASSLVGIVSERDLLFGLARTAISEARATVEPRRPEPPRRVEQIMSTRLVTAALDTLLSHCAGRMLDRRISALPVLEGESPRGIVTRRDVLAHMLEAFGGPSAPESRERPCAAIESTDRTEWLASELARPQAFPRDPGPIEVRRTLVSLLVFTKERVYKLKQALDLGFIDSRTLERRRFLCDEEVRLNARLAQGVHLGVVPIARGPDGHLVVGGSGEVVEWAVEMVRLPAERMLARRLELGLIDNAQMNALAALLADFHREAQTGPGVDELGTPAAIAVSIEENFEQLAPFVRRPGAEPAAGIAVLSSAQHAFLRLRARGFLARERRLLEARVAAGRIREGHGDLHAENVCQLPERLVVYDRIEFNPRLRCLDVANDLAFLAMDLDARGFSGFGAYLAHRYAEVASDSELQQLLGFYKGYRALVRAKVAALSARNPALANEARETLRCESMRYVQLALGYELSRGLVCLAGLPASGKSFLAARLALPLRAALLHSDVRRKRLAGLAATDTARAGWGEGLYSMEQRQGTYRSLLEDAVHALRSGRSVVVDASFTRRAFRRPFVDAAVRLGVPYCFVHVSAPEAVVRARLAARGPESGSDADFGIYLRERAAFEPLDEVPGGHVLDVRSGEGAPEDQVSQLLERLIGLEAAGR